MVSGSILSDLTGGYEFRDGMILRFQITKPGIFKTAERSRLGSYFQHTIERNLGPIFHVFCNANAVHHIAFHEVFERPSEMLRRNSKHCGAQTAGIVESNDLLTLFCKTHAHAVYEVNFGSDCEHRAAWSIFDDLDQPL